MNFSEHFDENNYEFNKESSNGVYIIHGFTNTTYEVKELAEYLSHQNFHVFANNLPGHGTTPKDCNRHTYKDWIQATEQGVAEMTSSCKNIFVIGISMGSVLALHLSSIFKFNASVFASTALNSNNYISIHILAPLFHRFVPFRSKRKTFAKEIRDDLKFLGYNVWPSSAVNEMRKLTNQVKKELSKVESPSLIIHSKADLLAPKSNLSLVFNSIKSKHKEKLLLDTAGHNLFVNNPEKIYTFEKISLFLKKNKN